MKLLLSKVKTWAILLILTHFGCLPIESTVSSSQPYVAKRLIYDNHIYDENIKTVRVFRFLNAYDDEIQPAAIPLNSEYQLIVEFDKLYDDFESLYAKIVHCNYDWTPSRLRDQEFMSVFNEFPITDYQYSRATRIPYTHYTLTLPLVKLPGNYLIKVYRDNNEDDLMLSRRFIVYDNRIQIDAQVGLSSGIVQRDFNQQIDFSLQYLNLELTNPLEEVKVVIRQNKRWDNTISLAPTSVREDRKTLEYQYFDFENNFLAGNEFRFFDLRTTNTLGQNIGAIDKKDNRIDAFILKDKSRGTEAYSSYSDINGEYVISSLESDPVSISGEYVNTHFFLQAETKISENVYVQGALTDWKLDDKSKLNYDPELGGYTGTVLLKQGWYNYLYYVQNASDPYYFEGNSYEAENLYEIMVYYHPIGSYQDLLIGYFSVYHNRRN